MVEIGIGSSVRKKYYYFLSIASLWLIDCFLSAEDWDQQWQRAYIKISKSKKAKEQIFITDCDILFEYFINPAKKPPM